MTNTDYDETSTFNNVYQISDFPVGDGLITRVMGPGLDNETLTPRIFRRRIRWLGHLTEQFIASSEDFAATLGVAMYDHAVRLGHLYVLWGHYRSIMFNDRDEHVTLKEIRVRCENWGTSLSARQITSFYKEGELTGLWISEQDEEDGRTKRIYPTRRMLRADLVGHIAGFLCPYIRGNTIEQQYSEDYWVNELGFELDWLKEMAEYMAKHASRTNPIARRMK